MALSVRLDAQVLDRRKVSDNSVVYQISPLPSSVSAPQEEELRFLLLCLQQYLESE